MHASVLAWVEATVDRLELRDARVLDIGSRDVNGSCRSIFRGPYVGIDRVAGPNVDIVASACSIPFPNASCDVVLSTEMLEHDDMFWHSVTEMGRVLKPHGHLLLTARGNGFPLHHEGEMGDFYRFMPQGMRMLLSLAGCEVLSVEEDPEVSGLFGLGRRLP